MEKGRKNNEIGEDQKFQIISNDDKQDGSYIKEKLAELVLISDELIQYALWVWNKNPQNKEIILKETEVYLTQRISHGSIGSATGAAVPLLNKKLKELYSIFKVKNNL